MPLSVSQIESMLGPDARSLVTFECKGLPKAKTHVPGSASVDRIGACRRDDITFRGFYEYNSGSRLCSRYCAVPDCNCVAIDQVFQAKLENHHNGHNESGCEPTTEHNQSSRRL